MGNIRIYTLYDIQTEEFGMPFYQKTDGAAKRTCKSSVPEDLKKDMKLYFLGYFDQKNGQIITEIQKSEIIWNEGE